MEFYLTPDATGYFETPLRHTIEIARHKIAFGFFPWLLIPFKKKYDVVSQFDIPVFFVCESDLGKSLKITEWHICRGEKYQQAINFTGSDKSGALNLPEYIDIPDAVTFDYEHNGRLIDPEIMRAGKEAHSIPQNIERRKGSFDWLGIYYGFQASRRCIFIRIEKIMEEESRLANPYGVASVVLHELAHALMDPREEAGLRFTMPVRRELADSLSYYVEEALANLIAYRSIRGRVVPQFAVAQIALFMEHQPFPYALGVRMGKAERTRYSSLDFIIKSYVLKWYGAKDKSGTAGIGDCDKWFAMIYDGKPFTDEDLREQYDTLFVKP